MSSAFASFNAYPVSAGNAIYTQWSFSSSFITNYKATTNFLYLLVTDASAVAAGNSISSVVVIPLKDASGNLTTSYTVTSETPGMRFAIQNGTRYQFMAQVVYTASGTITSSNSAQSVVMCSTIPSIPNFVLTPLTGSFSFQLLTDAGTTPQPISEFDGYGVLQGVFVTYSSANQLYSTFVANDASNNLYSEAQLVSCPLDTYEVSISSYNYTSSNGVYWGGRSDTSPSQIVVIDDTPGPVEDLTVFETMRDLSANVQQTYTYVSNTLTWSQPIYGASAETITSYNIYRNSSLINVFTDLSSGTMTYVDSDNTLTVGTLYTYAVAGVNENGEGTSVDTTITGVVFPTITAFTADPSGSQQLYLQVSLGANGFPLSSYSYDYSYNTAGSTPQTIPGPNPYLLAGLTNGSTYYLQAASSVPSLTDPSSVYTTVITNTISAVPYNPVLDGATDVSTNPLDISGNPSGSILLSWTNPANPIGITGTQVYNLYRKLTSAGDSTYTLINSSTIIPSSRSSYNDSAVVLGTSYTYKIVNVLTSGTKVITSDGTVSTSIIPFLAPSAVQNLSLFQPTVTDMSYSYTAPSAMGGYPLSAYYCSVYNLSDGSSVPIVVNYNNGATLKGFLSTIAGTTLTQGNQYKLVVSAAVSGNNGTGSNSTFYGATASAINFTVPSGINSPAVSNASSITNTIYNGIMIDWSTNSDYTTLDASNATFNIYKNASPLAIASGVTGTNYLDTTAVVGTDVRYQVVAVVNGVAAAFSGGLTPTPSVEIRSIRLPNQVAGPITAYNITNTTIDFSWNASTNGSGLAATALRYSYTLTNQTTGTIDASGVTTTTSASISSGLTASGKYTISVEAGIYTNSTFYFNTVNPATTSVSLYNSAPRGSYSAIYGSNTYVGTSSGALLTNIVNSTDISGLTFVSYTQQVATDVSFTNVISNTSSTSSEFYVTGLINGTTYYLRCAYIYENSLSVLVQGAWSPIQTGVPAISPNQPNGLEANTTGASSSIILYWNVPDPNAGVSPNTYSVQYGTNPDDLISDLSFNPVASYPVVIVNGVYKYSKNIQGLSAGTVYYLNVVAAVAGAQIAVSQPSVTIEAIPYTQPSAPQNLIAAASATSIDLTWTTPSTTGGAGQGSNGPLLYSAQIATDVSFTNILQTIDGISLTTCTFENLIDGSTYNVRVNAYFDVQSSGFVSSGPYELKNGVTTQNPPVNPILNFTAVNTAGTGTSTQKGKYVTVSWSWDTNFAGSVILQRQISDPDGVSLNGFYTVATASYSVGGSASKTFIDQGLTADASNSSVNFLNGNRMVYRLLSTYNGYPQQTITTTQASSYVVPFSDPIATDASGNPINASNVITPITPDGSGNYSSFYFRINKNGAPINSIVAVGLSSDEQVVPVITQSNPDIVYNNPQTNAVVVTGVSNIGGIAKNQYSNYMLTYTIGGVPAQVSNTLGVESNAAGALVVKQPVNGKFGN